MRCHGITLAGKRCTKKAQISGFCINHISSLKKQNKNREKQTDDVSEKEGLFRVNKLIRNTKDKSRKKEILDSYHYWLREQRKEDKMRLRREKNKEYRLMMKSSKKS